VFYTNLTKLPEVAKRLPLILCVVIVLLSLMVMAQALYGKKKGNSKVENKNIDVKTVVLFTVVIALYVFTIKPIGYFIVTPIFLIFMLRYLKTGSWLKTMLIAGGFTLFVYLLFVLFLKLPVPLGILESFKS
jgi:uncharacterized membrane protein